MQVEEFVPLRKLCQELGIDFYRQREKVGSLYEVKTKRMFSRNGNYKMLCLSRKDADDFLKRGGIWIRGRYKAKT